MKLYTAYFSKSLISQKYKKFSPTKYALLLYLAVSIRLVSIMFDAYKNRVFFSQLFTDLYDLRIWVDEL